MKPFIAWITFQTPLILATPLTLDALIIGEIALHVGNEEAIMSAPFLRTEGIPHASQVYLVDAMRSTTVSKVINRSTEVNTAPLDHVGRTRLGHQGTLSLNDNKFKSTLNTYDARSIERAFFAGTGNVDEIRDVMNDLRAIGKRRSDGYGMIMDLGVDEVDEDPALWGLLDRRANPMRPVPLDLFISLGGQADPLIHARRARPFYWDPANQPIACAVPSSTDPRHLRHE